jgi:hypothetical protein
MTFRKFLLLSMLVVLALCAVTGVLAVFTRSEETLWRVVMTAIDTAVATGLLLPMTWLAARPRLRVGALTGMGVVLACWALLLGALWLPDLAGFPHYRMEEKLLLSTMFTLFMGLPSAVALLVVTFRWARVAVWTFVGGAALAFLLCELDVLFEVSHYGETLLACGMTIYGMNTCAAALLVNFGCGDRRYFRWAGVACAAAATILFLLVISDHAAWTAYAPTLGRKGGVLAVAAIVMAHVNLVLMAKLRRTQQWLQWGTIAVSLVGGFSGIYSFLFEFNTVHVEWATRSASGAAIVAACGSLALIVLTLMNRKVETPFAVPGALEATAMDIVCPRCHTPQHVPFGESVCKSCDLQFSIKVTEPRCAACGYLLYQLTGNKCPECGAPLGAAPAGAPSAV